MTSPGCPRVPLAYYPGINRFVLDWLGGDERFLSRRLLPTSRPTNPTPALVDALIESNRRWGSFVGPEARRWAAGGTVTLIAGQQVGFAGGPLYTLAKIATLLRMRKDVEAAGKQATVFFWLATEDHDFNEVATQSLPAALAKQDSQLDLVHMRATRAIESHRVVGTFEVPEPLIAELLGVLGIDRPSWLRSGITFRDSFAELLSTVLAEQKVIFVDALLPELRAEGAPLFARLRERWDDMQRAVTARSGELAAAGYEPQVVPPREGEEYTLLFALDDEGNRVPYDRHNPLPAARTSTSAITRPLLQDFVLQPDVLVGGPAEVAYYAQLAPLHAMLNVRMPRVALRGHALVAPKRVVRFFERYAIEPQEVFAGADALLTEREPEEVAAVRQLADEARRELAEKITRIGEIALPAEHALARAISRSIGHIEYHFDKLTERAIRGLVRKDRERYAAVKELVATLYPDHHVQDRIVGWIAYWCEFRDHLVERLVDCIEPDSDHFRIISL